MEQFESKMEGLWKYVAVAQVGLENEIMMAKDVIHKERLQMLLDRLKGIENEINNTKRRDF